MYGGQPCVGRPAASCGERCWAEHLRGQGGLAKSRGDEAVRRPAEAQRIELGDEGRECLTFLFELFSLLLRLSESTFKWLRNLSTHRFLDLQLSHKLLRPRLLLFPLRPLFL